MAKNQFRECHSFEFPTKSLVVYATGSRKWASDDPYHLKVITRTRDSRLLAVKIWTQVQLITLTDWKGEGGMKLCAEGEEHVAPGEKCCHKQME